MKRENSFRKSTLKEIKKRIPGIIISAPGIGSPQGFPDSQLYYNGLHAYIEFKRSKNSDKQPNQEYYIDKFKKEGIYAAIIYPENKEAILDELEQSLLFKR